MSKPSKLSQVTIGDVAPSTGPQPTLVDANGRIRAMGTRGALVTGGPILEGRMLKSTTVTNQTLTADQLVGGHVSFQDNMGAAATITMPTATEIFTYLTREWFTANGDPTTNVNTTTLLTLPSIPVTSFRCTFSVGTGNVPTLSWASGIEYYPRGPSNAPLGGTTFALTASTLATFEFFTIQSSSVVSPRIGFYLVWTVGLGGAYVAPNWSAVLAVGNTSGAFNPTINAGQRIQYTAGISIGGNGAGTGAVATTSIAIGASANASGGSSVAIGGGTFATANNCVAVGLNANAGANPSTAVGSNSIATDVNSCAFGPTALAAATGTVAIGFSAGATFADAICIGRNALAGATSAIAIGVTSQATGSSSLAFGPSALASVGNSVALGSGAQATAAQSTAIGASANTNFFNTSTAIGYNAQCTAANQIMLGFSFQQVAIPGNAVMTDTALGTTNAMTLNYLAGVPIGAPPNGSVVVDGTDSRLYARIGGAWKYIDIPTAGGSSWANTLAIGNTSGAYNPTINSGQLIQYVAGVAIGGNSVATGGVHAEGVAIGSAAAATQRSVAVGLSANASGLISATALGHLTVASGGYTSALGYQANASDSYAVALGAGTSAAAAQAVSIGRAASVSAAGTSSVAIGYNSAVTHASSVALGTGATTTAANQIMLGTATETPTFPGKALFVSGIAIGGNNTAATATSTTSVAIGSGATTAALASSVALGAGATATSANQVMLGTAAETVRCPNDVQIARHLFGVTTVPTCTGVSGSAPLAVGGVTVAGSDLGGVVTFTTQGGAARGTVTISFGAAWPVAPIVVVTPGANNCKADIFIVSVSNLAFVVDFDSLANVPSGFTYICMGR